MNWKFLENSQILQNLGIKAEFRQWGPCQGISPAFQYGFRTTKNLTFLGTQM